MITELVFLPLNQMKQVRPARDTLVISILDRSEASGRPRLAGFRSVLCLDFEDCCEAPGDELWPDEPTDEQHDAFCMGPGERLPTLSDAKRIVEFVSSHRHSAERLRLVIHCQAGISRSAAVAEWASVTLWLPISNGHQRSTARANQRVLRLLNKAAGRI